MKIIFFTFIIFIINANHSFANDGAFYAAGNHLIPIIENDISVQKEILYIKKVENLYFEISVYYEFYNPKNAKNVLVGFEAESPSGDVDVTPINGKHPYMREFTVNLNDKNLDYEVAYVKDSNYVKDNKIFSLKQNEVLNEIDDLNDAHFDYVYYFNANFKKGLNIIKHTYKFDISNSVDFIYTMSYVLTAANRWSNSQIDDFTLILDLGYFESFYIIKDFFDKNDDWIINGIGNSANAEESYTQLYEYNANKFNIQSGTLILTKKNFHPKGNLYLNSIRHYYVSEFFDYRKDSLPFSITQQEIINPPVDEISKSILRNLPYARRGYIFKNKEIQNYYEKFTDWYIKNPNYIPYDDYLFDEEKEWVKKWK